MRSEKIFSIITIHLNYAHGLKATQDSLLSQTCQDYEWIIIDGGSGPETQRFLRHSKAAWVSEPDKGIYDAMNKGLDRVRATYILFLNAGDQLAAPDTLQKIKAAITEEPDFIYGDSIESGNIKPARPHHRILNGMFTHHQAMFYNRKSLDNLRYDINYKIAADYKFTLAFLRKAKTILYCPFPVCIFEPGGVSQMQTRLGRVEQFLARKELDACHFLHNCAIYAAQSAIMALRRISPRLYWFLRNLR